MALLIRPGKSYRLPVKLHFIKEKKAPHQSAGPIFFEKINKLQWNSSGKIHDEAEVVLLLYGSSLDIGLLLCRSNCC